MANIANGEIQIYTNSLDPTRFNVGSDNRFIPFEVKSDKDNVILLEPDKMRGSPVAEVKKPKKGKK